MVLSSPMGRDPAGNVGAFPGVNDVAVGVQKPVKPGAGRDNMASVQILRLGPPSSHPEGVPGLSNRLKSRLALGVRKVGPALGESPPSSSRGAVGGLHVVRVQATEVAERGFPGRQTALPEQVALQPQFGPVYVR